MSERGTFAIDRGIWGSHNFAQEPFTEREAFMWLISEAAYTAHTKRIGALTVDLERGQTCHSVRFMAEVWQWSKSAVDRFLKKLEKRDTIKRDTGTEPVVITICNYCTYQPAQKTAGTQDGTPAGTVAGQQRDTAGTPAGQSRDKLEKGNNSNPSLRSGVTSPERKHPWPADYQDQFWATYPRRTARKKAFEVLDRIAKADSVPFAEIVAGSQRLAEWAGDREDKRFLPHPSTWLNGERWADELPAKPPPSGGDRSPRPSAGGGFQTLNRNIRDLRNGQSDRAPEFDLQPHAGVSPIVQLRRAYG